MKNIKCHLYFGLIVFGLIIFCSCKKLVDIPLPDTSLTSENVYQSDASAAAVLTGLYIQMSGTRFTAGSSGFGTISGRSGLSADELVLYSGSISTLLQAYYRNDLNSQLFIGPWRESYTFLQTINSVLEGLATSSLLTPSVKQQLEGEAKFLRAFCYFYLVNFYGDVPLALSSDWRINDVLSRSDKAQVWRQIITDLKDAQNLLNTQYLAADAKTASIDRVRPTKWAATAMLARTYLYLGDWMNAEDQATNIIANSNLYDTVSLSNVFLKNSKEAIWQLMPVNPGRNTEEARVYILTGSPNGNKPVYLSSFLLNSFETGDLRKINWIGSRTVGATKYFYPFKYKADAIPVTNPPTSPTEYLMVLRLAEIYLIRAEARAQLGKINGAQDDLNIIRQRAGITNTTASDQASLLTAILHERQVELFTEWGHRWFDLIRTNNINSVMSVVTPTKTGGSNWNSYQQLYPIYFKDIELNRNLVQNTGY